MKRIVLTASRPRIVAMAAAREQWDAGTLPGSIFAVCNAHAVCSSGLIDQFVPGRLRSPELT